MKKIITITTLFVCLGLFAQQGVAKKVAALVSQKKDFKKVSVLTVSESIANRETSKVVDGATYAKLNPQSLTNVMAAKQEQIELEVPYQGQTILVQLYKVNPFAEGFHVDTDKARSIAYEQGLYYRGIIKGDRNSVASFNFFNGEFNGIVSGSSVNNLVIGKLDKPNNTSDYIIYSDAEMKMKNNFECKTRDIITSKVEHIGRARENIAPKCVTIYLEIDYDLYTQNNSNTTTTTNWVTSVFNNVQTLYANDDIAISLKSTYIWTQDDPYDGTKSSDYLYQFNDLRPAFDGDVGQLLGIDPGGLGGVAATIGGLCSQNNFSYSDVDFSYSTVPTYSWTIMVITHEFGHLLGSPHTHACVWNGNNTAIDNCAPVALGSDWQGGNCMTDPPTLPSQSVKGSIMSYCHLLNIGISFSNGFGPQPKAAILNAINNVGCLSTDCINTCINAVGNITSTLTGTSVTVNWEELGSATTWQVAVEPFNNNVPTWTSVNSATYIRSGLQSNTFYKVWVRPNCGSGLTPPQEEYIFLTGTSWCDGIEVTDTGGTNGDYTDSESYIRTIIPNLPNKKIKLTFTHFDLESDYDYLYVYNGNNTSAPDLSSGGFTGNKLPAAITSSASDGSLTMQFYSDGGVVTSGYAANTECLDLLGTNGFAQDIDFTYFPNPTNGIVSITSKTPMREVKVYNIAGQLLYQGAINALDTKVDLSAFATGTYFFKLKFNDKETNFKIQKM